MGQPGILVSFQIFQLKYLKYICVECAIVVKSYFWRCFQVKYPYYRSSSNHVLSSRLGFLSFVKFPCLVTYFVTWKYLQILSSLFLETNLDILTEFQGFITVVLALSGTYAFCLWIVSFVSSAQPHSHYLDIGLKVSLPDSLSVLLTGNMRFPRDRDLFWGFGRALDCNCVSIAMG